MLSHSTAAIIACSALISTAVSGRTLTSSKLGNDVCTTSAEIVADIWPQLVAEGDLLSTGRPSVPTEIVQNPQPHVQAMTPKSLAWQMGWSGTQPSEELVSAWYKSRSSISSCLPSLQAKPKPRTITPSEARKILSAANGSAGGPFVLDISSPVLDRDRLHALLVYDKIGNGLGGRTQFYHFKRTGGKWKLIGTRLTQIS